MLQRETAWKNMPRVVVPMAPVLVLPAKRYPAFPVIGGLFLAFPAIFPASASLIEAHEKADSQASSLPCLKKII